LKKEGVVSSIEIISTDKVPAAIGPYSQGVKAGGLIFFSGQIPLDPDSGAVCTGDIAEQTELVMNNMPLLQPPALWQHRQSNHLSTDLADFAVVNGSATAVFRRRRPPDQR
jgi:2-iminobutanoate/2-iminopropanoate deaminase